ncbi:MAG: peptidoglycan DD-metalloendopeptidase family protein [Dysgonomonas sp.]
MKRLLLLVVLLISILSFAQNSKVKELEQQRKQALLEISNTDKLLRETKRNTSTLLDRIKLISNQLLSRQQVLNLLNQEIDAIGIEQKKIEEEITILESELKDKQKNYAKAIDGMLLNRQSKNKMLFVLSGKSLTESYRRFKYLKDYSEWRSAQADDIKDKRDKLKERKETLDKTKREKLILAGQRKTEQNNLQAEEENYQKEVGEAKQKQTELQKLLAQKRKQAEMLDKQITKLIAEEVARQERKAKSAAATAAKPTTKGAEKPASSATNSENITLSNNFSSNKGKLPYPINGNYTITNRFGTHQHSQWQVTTSSNGIDIQSQPGAEAKAVFNGEVSRIVAFPGYNNCIIIRHGNYYTFYGNIQSVSVKQGDKVKTGQTLGTVYTDPDKGVSQLHFQLWQGTNKQNPEPWLRR